MGICNKSSGSGSKEPQKEERKKKKEREWKDANEDLKFVCHGGKMQCNYCNPPIADIIVTTETIMLQDKPWGTVGDKDGKVNFGFMGLCMHPSQQKPLSPPPPCKSIISLGEWQDFSDTIIGGNNALLVKSVIPCMISGENLKIIHSGQMATPTQISPLERERKKRIVDVYWIDQDTGEKMREVREGKAVALHITTRGYKVGEQATVKIEAEPGREFATGGTEMTVAGEVNSDKVAIIDNFVINYK